MGLAINFNSAAMAAHRNLSKTSNALTKSIERMSSGYKINSASDDPAGLVVSEKLRAQVSGIKRAISNAGDATNMIKTAEGALGEVNDLLRTMRDLAVHAANTGANDDATAAADQTQIANAIESLNKIAAETQFGNKKLLDGTAGQRAMVTGDKVTNGNFSYAKNLSDGDVISVNVTTSAEQATVKTSVDLSTGAAADGDFYLNGVKVSYAKGDSAAAIVDNINSLQSQTGVTAKVDGNNITFNSVAFGSNAKVSLVGVDASLSATDLSDSGVDAAATVTVGGTNVSDASWTGGSGLTLKDSAGNSIDLTRAAGTSVSDKGAQFQMSGGALVFQVGAYSGQTRTISIGDTNAAALGTTAVAGKSVADIDVSTGDGAQQALDILDAAISQVSTMRANLGAMQTNVLESAINSLTTAQENIAASESSIRDTDVAEEMAKFTSLQIMNQAGTAMLAQANQMPQQLLSLLQ